MKDILIEYRRYFMRCSLIRSCPERWEELNERQLIAIARFSMAEIDEQEYLVKFLNIPRRIVKLLDTYEIYRIKQLISFTEGFEPWYKFILKLPGLSAPRPRLEGMTFGQYMFVDTFYNDWLEDPSAELLNKFVGSLYLPEKEAFDTEKIGIYTENAAQLQEDVKIAITLNYRLMIEWMANLYQLLFPRVAAEETKNQDESKKKTDTRGWLDVFEGIVGDDLIHQEEYFMLPVHTVLRFLTKKMKENAKR